MFLSACNSGFLLGFACATTVSTNSSEWFQINAAGLIKTISAMVFPYGLVMIVLTGSDLVTSAFMFSGLAALHRRIGIVKMLVHWAVCFLGNLCGSLFIVCVIVGCEFTCSYSQHAY
jgi:formate/nitrite transporter FocA (FNT family)